MIVFYFTVVLYHILADVLQGLFRQQPFLCWLILSQIFTAIFAHQVEQKLQQVSKNTKNNKVSIQNYIRLFETIVIKALKLYTSSNNVVLQVRAPCC